jgi:dienelactone hydrolase
MGNPFLYHKLNNGANLQLTEETPRWSRYEVEIPSVQQVQYLVNSQIRGEYFLPRGREKAPLVVIVHGMAAKSVIPGRMIAHTLAKKGFACFVLYLIFHNFRAPASLKAKYPKLTSEEWFESYQTSVTDIRQVIDWAEERPEIDCSKISLVGISLGSFVSTIAIAIDKRIRAGILILSGGNSEKITRRSLLLRLTYKNNSAEYLRNQESYFQYLKQVAEKGFENAIADKDSYLTDPLTFSGYLQDRSILMLGAQWDEIIPKSATLDFWKACGRPPIFWYPATHSSIWVWYPLIGKRISHFLKSRLE